MTRNRTEHAAPLADSGDKGGVGSSSRLAAPPLSDFIHDKSTSADIAAHTYGARLTQHFEPETDGKWPSGWWIIPAFVFGTVVWVLLIWWAVGEYMQ